MGVIKLCQVAPDFNLNDFNGQQVTLVDYLRKKIVILVFNRGFF